MEGCRVIMDLPLTKLRQEYTDEIKVIEANIKDIASGSAPRELYDYSQNKLDNLAKRFQYEEQLGAARYKLYELQALLYYFQNRDDEALAFIQQAVKVKGTSYKRAEQLIDQIESAPAAPIQTESTAAEENLTKQEKRKKLIGVDGWLALYVLGLFIGTIITVYNFFDGGIGLSSSTIDTLNQYQSGLGDTFSTLTTFENMALVVYAALLISAIVLILRRKKVAKSIAIAGMIFGAVYSVVDYAVASSLFDSANLTQYVQSELNSAAGYAGRDIMVALIWIPYFLVSKRAKATLTK